jgi:hypothetical protein
MALSRRGMRRRIGNLASALADERDTVKGTQYRNGLELASVVIVGAVESSPSSEQKTVDADQRADDCLLDMAPGRHFGSRAVDRFGQVNDRVSATSRPAPSSARPFRHGRSLAHAIRA